MKNSTFILFLATSVIAAILVTLLAVSLLPKSSEPADNPRETAVYKRLEENRVNYGNPKDWGLVCQVYYRGGADRVDLVGTIAGTDSEFEAVELFIVENC